jgi:uncharacterized protein YlxP (DUF503 family)
MVLGLLELDLMIRGARSLKEKRRAVKSYKDRIRARFNVSIAEVGDQDLYQRADIAVACVGTDVAFVQSVLQRVTNQVAFIRDLELIDHSIEIL